MSNAAAESQLIAQVAMYTLFPFLLAFAFVFFIFYRQSRENRIRKNVMELELKALRAQMNPHFIFNCLTSIYYCIQKGKNDQAGEYLMKFSFLARRVLENSGKRWITLEEDIEMLQAYLELEQLRTNHKFTFEIRTSKELKIADTSVLMLLSQPFVENSIWHGFDSDAKNCRIEILIELENGMLKYRIEDNGNNKTQALEPARGKKKSMGTTLVKEQLDAINALHKSKAYFTSEEMKDEHGNYLGRRVELFLPLLIIY